MKLDVGASKSIQRSLVPPTHSTKQNNSPRDSPSRIRPLGSSCKAAKLH
jgi:hypothetical protein